MAVYLHLNCEGWERFGPFEWLRFRDHQRIIEDENGRIVASFDGAHWLASASSMSWSDPLITSQDRHPHPSQGRF